MRYLNKIIFLNSAHVPYAEIRLDGNVHFIGTQGVGKSTLLRAILFFYNANKSALGIPREKQNFDSFYLPYDNSYVVYEVLRENGAYCVVLTKSMGRAAFRFVDAPFSKDWLVNENNEVLSDWSEIRKRLPENCTPSTLITEYYEFRDIIFGNNKNPDLAPFRKYAIVESNKYQNIPRTIQNVFLNSKLDADFIKNTIIQSMNEQDISIDLAYYRSQIESFEQEYKDVMLWLKVNKNGVNDVRKQADRVIRNYHGLLYQNKQLQDGRAELNYAEKQARQLLPDVQEQLHELARKVDHYKHLLDEEKTKYDHDRDKLVGAIATLKDKLKSVGEKHKFYEEENIEEVIRRVANEGTLLHELEGVKHSYEELTATHRDVIQKYEVLLQQVEHSFADFEHQQKEEMLKLNEDFSTRSRSLHEELREKENLIRHQIEEKQQVLNEQHTDLIETMSELKQRRSLLNHTLHFQKEMEACRTELATLDKREGELKLQIDQCQLQVEQLKSQFSDEIKNREWDHKVKSAEIRQRRDETELEIERLQKMVARWKGSFYEWLDTHLPNWQQTVGKVVNEEEILFNAHLHPVLGNAASDELFGIKLDLSAVERELHSPKQINEELATKVEMREEYTRQLQRLGQELDEQLEEIRKKCNKLVREITDQQFLLDNELQLIPSKRKNAQVDLSTWQRKEEEWKQEQLSAIDLEWGEKKNAQDKVQLQMEELSATREKNLKHAYDDFLKSEKQAEDSRDAAIHKIQEDINAKRTEADQKKADLQQSQSQELNGKGVDSTVIDKFKKEIEDIECELQYVKKKQALVFEYEKDKREFFDHEQKFRDEKHSNETSLAHLDEKYQLLHEKYLSKQNEVLTVLNAKKRERENLEQDLAKLKNFREDPYLCPVDSDVVLERPTTKSCGVLIGELTSLVVSIQKETNTFKQSVNSFQSYFNERNTFSFPLPLLTDTDYYNYASNLCEFVDNNKIAEYQSHISERYVDIIRRISKLTGDLTQNESEIHRTITAINNDFIERNFAGVIKSIELRPMPSNDKLMQLLIEIKAFNEENEFNMGTHDLFSQESRVEINKEAVKYLSAFSRLLRDEPSRKSLSLSDTFNLQFRIVENDNDSGWKERMSNVGSEGTDILVKAMINIMLLNVFKEKASRKFGDFKIHCMMDEIGKLHPNNVKGILEFANCRNILLINSSPTTYNAEDYRYTYLLSKDEKSNTRVIPLLSRHE